MPEVIGFILGTPDPWRWGKKMMGGKVLKCADKKAVQVVQDLVGMDLSKASYFAGGFLLYDTAIVRDYPGERNSPSSSLIELYKVYHQHGKVFEGDQEALATYWVYTRKKFHVLPLTMLGSPRVPYEFIRLIRGDPYIVTAGNADRPVCVSRPTNNLSVQAAKQL